MKRAVGRRAPRCPRKNLCLLLPQKSYNLMLHVWLCQFDGIPKLNKMTLFACADRHQGNQDWEAHTECLNRRLKFAESNPQIQYQTFISKRGITCAAPYVVTYSGGAFSHEKISGIFWASRDRLSTSSCSEHVWWCQTTNTGPNWQRSHHIIFVSKLMGRVASITQFWNRLPTTNAFKSKTLFLRLLRVSDWTRIAHQYLMLQYKPTESGHRLP